MAYLKLMNVEEVFSTLPKGCNVEEVLPKGRAVDVGCALGVTVAQVQSCERAVRGLALTELDCSTQVLSCLAQWPCVRVTHSCNRQNIITSNYENTKINLRHKS